MRRESRGDAAAPAFRGTRADVCRLSQEECELVGEYPARGMDPEELRTKLGELFARHLANGRSPRFQNQLFSGVTDEAMAGMLLGVFANNTLSTREIAPLGTEIERAVIGWLVRLLPWAAHCADGTVTPGGSFSNYLAVYLGRKRATAKHGDEVLPRLALFTSKEAHYSIPKGADLAGIPLSGVIEVPTDELSRMRPDALATAVDEARQRGLLPFFVNATVGTTVAGAIDPVPEIARVAREKGMWLHVDAAWGGFGLLGSQAGVFRAGLEHADSVTWDAHKSGSSPLAVSFLLVREREVLRALRPPTGGGYLFPDRAAPEEEADLGLTSLYCGKPFLSLALWLNWKARGESGLRARVDRAAALTRRFRDHIETSTRYELALEPRTWSVCFRPRVDGKISTGQRNSLAGEVRTRINASGKWMLNLCPLGDSRVLRAIFVNPLLTEAHVDELFVHVEACHPAPRAAAKPRAPRRPAARE